MQKTFSSMAVFFVCLMVSTMFFMSNFVVVISPSKDDLTVTNFQTLDQVCERVNTTNIVDLLAYTDPNPTQVSKIGSAKPAAFIRQYVEENPTFVGCLEDYFGVTIII